MLCLLLWNPSHLSCSMTSRQFDCSFRWCADYELLLIRRSIRFVFDPLFIVVKGQMKTKMSTTTITFNDSFLRIQQNYLNKWIVIFFEVDAQRFIPIPILYIYRLQSIDAEHENNKLQMDIYVWHCDDALTECNAFIYWQTKTHTAHSTAHTNTARNQKRNARKKRKEKKWWIASVAHVTKWNGIDRTENQHLPNVGLMSF